MSSCIMMTLEIYVVVVYMNAEAVLVCPLKVSCWKLIK